MIVIYKKISAKQIRKEAAKGIVGIEEWFQKNPKRKICNVCMWYGQALKVRRGHVAEDVNAAAETTIKNDRGAFIGGLR